MDVDMPIHMTIPNIVAEEMNSLRGPIETAATNLPYWGLDDEIDERSGALWSIGVPIETAARIVGHLCAQLSIPDVTLVITETSSELVDDALEDPDLLEAFIDVSEDAWYQEPDDISIAQITFDEFVTDHGTNVPLQLLIHELSHHVEWHTHGGTGHDEPFADALRDVTDRMCQLVDLADRLVPVHTPEPLHDKWERRHAILAMKWRELASAAEARRSTDSQLTLFP